MPEVRLIDANALIKDIAESIRLADEWEKESHEKKDKNGLKCAIDTRRSLLAMISRVKEAPTIEPEVRYGRWIETKYNPVGDTMYCDCNCSYCNFEITREKGRYPKFCEGCGARMDAEDINVLTKDGGSDNATD